MSHGWLWPWMPPRSPTARRVLGRSRVSRGGAIPVAWKVVGALEKGSWEPHWLGLLQALAGSVPQQWTVIVMSDRGLYAPWLYAKIVSLRWHPFMRINKQGYFRALGEDRFRSLASAAPTVGSAWCGKLDCFSQEKSRLRCKLFARLR
jgi:hypothetical protein